MFSGILELFLEPCSGWMRRVVSGLRHDGSHAADSSPHWSEVTSKIPHILNGQEQYFKNGLRKLISTLIVHLVS